MGWLYAGNILVSVLCFVGFMILVFVEAAVVGVTLGLGACLIIPFNLAIGVVSGLRVRDYVRNSGAKGSLIYLILGLVGGGVLICRGLFALTTILDVAGGAFDTSFIPALIARVI